MELQRQVITEDLQKLGTGTAVEATGGGDMPAECSTESGVSGEVKFSGKRAEQDGGLKLETRNMTIPGKSQGWEQDAMVLRPTLRSVVTAGPEIEEDEEAGGGFKKRRGG